MNEQTIEFIKETIEGAGKLGSMAYEAALKHAVVSGTVDVVGGLLVVMVGIIILVLAWKATSGKQEDTRMGIRAVAIVACGSTAIVGIVLAWGGVVTLLAPEWAAISTLMSSINPPAIVGGN